MTIQHVTWMVYYSPHASQDSRHPLALRFCQRHFLSSPILHMLMKMSRQLSTDFERFGYVHPRERTSPPPSIGLVLAILSAGCYPNVVYRPVGHTNYTTKDQHKVKLHRSSLVSTVEQHHWKRMKHHRTSSSSSSLSHHHTNEPEHYHWLMFSEMIQTDRHLQMHDGTRVSDAVVVLLMGQEEACDVITECQMVKGTNEVQDVEKVLLIVDDWIVYEMPSLEMAQEILTLRRRLRRTLVEHYQHPKRSRECPEKRLLLMVLTQWIEEDQAQHCPGYQKLLLSSRGSSRTTRASSSGRRGRGRHYRQ